MLGDKVVGFELGAREGDKITAVGLQEGIPLGTLVTSPVGELA